MLVLDSPVERASLRVLVPMSMKKETTLFSRTVCLIISGVVPLGHGQIK